MGTSSKAADARQGGVVRWIMTLAPPSRAAFLAALLAAAAVSALTVLLGRNEFGRSLENAALDMAYTLRATAAEAPASTDILLVAIDEPSFQELQRPWPWPRSLHAECVRRLREAGARLIVFDVIFAEHGDPVEDAALVQAVAGEGAGDVVVAQTIDHVVTPQFERTILVTPFDALDQAAAGKGLALLVPDEDGVVRRLKPVLGGLPTLAAQAARLLDEQRLVTQLRALEGREALLDYAGPAGTLPVVSYYQVVDERPLPAALVRGKTVFIGRTLAATAAPEAQADAFRTPFHGVHGRLMAGVEIHANALRTLLAGGATPVAGEGLRLGVTVALLLAGALAFFGRPPVTAGLRLALLLLLLGGVSYALFVSRTLWLAPALTAGGLGLLFALATAWGQLVEMRERRWLRGAFGRYVSPTVVDALIEQHDRLELGGEEVEATVLFSDLAGFTGLSETMTPRELIAFLNDYFTPIGEVIKAEAGTLDKFIGDAVMAFWGAPLPQPDHARRACRAALAMQTTLAGLRDEWRARGETARVNAHARIGLHSGALVVGNVGSRDRFDYTCLGDAVNLASRLEGVNKVYGTSILVSEAVATALGESTATPAGEGTRNAETPPGAVVGGFLLREVDRLRVKGRAQPVRVYELLDEVDYATDVPAWLTTFHAARAAYGSQRFDEAEALFREVLTHRSPGDAGEGVGEQDGPSRVFLARIAAWRETPPPPDWDGVHTLTSK